MTREPPSIVPPSRAGDGVPEPAVGGGTGDDTGAGQSAEHRFRVVTTLSADWYWEQDADLRFVTLHGDLQRQSGFTVEEHIGKTRWELPLLGVTPEQMAAHRKLLEARQPFRNFEFQRPLPDGGHHWVSISGDPMFAPDGRFTGYCGVGRNIDRAKRAETGLQAANAELSRQLEHQREMAQWLALALESSGAATWSFDLVDGIVRHNAGWFGLLGLAIGDPEESVTQFESMIHPDDVRPAREAMREHLKGHSTIFDTRFRMRHADGRWVWIGSRGRVVRRSANGQATMLAGTHRDVSAEVQLGEQFERQTAQWQGLVDSSGVGMKVFNANRIVYLNAALARLLGYDHVQQLLDLPIDETVVPEERQHCRERRESTIAGEQGAMTRMTMLSATGRRVPVLVSSVPVIWEGRPHGLSIIQAARDEDLLAVQLDATRARYNQLLAQQREAYSARAVRDLRDALGSDVTGVSLLLGAMRARVVTGGVGMDELLTMIDRLQKQVGHLAVNARRIAKGLMPVVMDAGGLPAALEQFAEQALAAWELACELDIDAQACPASNEACTHLFRIVQESARNAVRHGDANSLRIVLRREGALGMMLIEDDGAGFDAQAVLSEEQPGTGLRTMMALANAINGRIVFGQGPQRGAAIRVEYGLE